MIKKFFKIFFRFIRSPDPEDGEAMDDNFGDGEGMDEGYDYEFFTDGVSEVESPAIKDETG